MALNYKDKNLLDRIKLTLNCGNITYNPLDKTYKWKVSDFDQIDKKIIPHFFKYRLMTQKGVDFAIFVKIIEKIKNKEHLGVFPNKKTLLQKKEKDNSVISMEASKSKGLQDIINLKGSLNLGLSYKLKERFPGSIPATRDKIKFEGIPDPNWLSGFVDGEGCFYVSVYKSPKSKLGFAVQLVFKITQHLRDVDLFKGIADYYKCGRIEYLAPHKKKLVILLLLL